MLQNSLFWLKLWSFPSINQAFSFFTKAEWKWKRTMIESETYKFHGYHILQHLPSIFYVLFPIFPAFSGSLSCLSCACLLQKISTSSWLLVLTCLLLKSTGSSFCSPSDHDVYVTFRLLATPGKCRFMWMSSCLRWHPCLSSPLSQTLSWLFLKTLPAHSAVPLLTIVMKC